MDDETVDHFRVSSQNPVPKPPLGVLARITFEKLSDRKKAEALLREFLDQPLLGRPIAPQALLYLAEKVIDGKANRKDALAVLSKIIHRRDASPETTRRAKKLHQQLLQPNGSAGR